MSRRRRVAFWAGQTVRLAQERLQPLERQIRSANRKAIERPPGLRIRKTPSAGKGRDQKLRMVGGLSRVRGFVLLFSESLRLAHCAPWREAPQKAAFGAAWGITEPGASGQKGGSWPARAYGNPDLSVDAAAPVSGASAKTARPIERPAFCVAQA